MLVEMKTNKNIHSGQCLSNVQVSYLSNNNYQNKHQRLSLSSSQISCHPQDFLGPFSASVKVGHCGLALQGHIIKLLLEVLFAKLSAAVDSCGLAIKDCAVILP